MIRCGALAALCALLLLPGIALAGGVGRLHTDRADYVDCVGDVSARFGIPEIIIWVILDVEGGTLGKTTKNTDGTYDIGPMQVNSWWLSHFGKRGISEDLLLNNLCVNIAAGAWIYSTELKRHRGDFAKAVATYHSPTPRHQRVYLNKVHRALAARRQAYLRDRRASVERPGQGVAAERVLGDVGGAPAGG